MVLFTSSLPYLQLIFLGLVVTFLWDGTPIVGSDGRMVCEFADFTSDRPRWEGDMLLEGRTSELFGPDLVPTDLEMRNIGYHQMGVNNIKNTDN